MSIRASALALATAMTATPAAAADLKACFMYVGPVGDFGWSYQHDQGRKALETELGSRVETHYAEKVAEGPAAAETLRDLARSGCGLIFATSFGYMDAVIKVAAEFPDVKFEHATGYRTAPNVAVYNSHFYEGRAVLGDIAARMTKSKKIGYVASMPIPEVYQGINAATLAARAIDPEIEMHIAWVNSWFDPIKETEAANALLEAGVDVIMQHTDSPSPIAAAARAGALGFGQAGDMSRFAPGTQLTAIIDEWGPYYISRAKAVLDGTWESGAHFGSIADGGVVLSPFENMPDEVAQEAQKVADAIASGARSPFAGPIISRNGETKAEAGETLSQEAIESMKWLVEGVVGPAK